MKKSKIVVLTGAGISAESGVKTFRDNGGLWENHRIEDVATPEAFRRDPEFVHRFYNLRREQLKEVQPNKAHLALSQLEEADVDFFLVTQNVDDLHERAGSKAPLHMHGELKKVRCLYCESVFVWENELTTRHLCPECRQHGEWGSLRPHIVWFGEMPFDMPLIEKKLRNCDIFIAVGTSGQVYPAAGFVELAKDYQAKTLLFNLEEQGQNRHFDEVILGPAGKTLSEWVNDFIAQHGV
jgi:NAD-dependent deacetylase